MSFAPTGTDPGGEAERSARDEPDENLVADFRRHRDESSFRRLYRRHTPFVYRYCLGRLRDPGEAESAVQETWLRAVRALERFDGRSTFRSWLVGIARNCCREQARRQARLVLVGDTGPPVPATEPPPAGGGIDLARAVAGLPERARAVLLLHDVEGCTHVEIGDILGVDPGTSKSQLSRARRLLRRALSGGDHHEPV